MYEVDFSTRWKRVNVECIRSLNARANPNKYDDVIFVVNAQSVEHTISIIYVCVILAESHSAGESFIQIQNKRADKFA